VRAVEQALLASGHFKLHAPGFSEGFEPAGLNFIVVSKQIREDALPLSVVNLRAELW
jgi:hypothetical protein